MELGCGTGANLPFYPAAVSSLLLAEPDKYMRQQLLAKLPKYSNLQPSILVYDGESNSIDAVVCTLVLCTVKDPQKILYEAYRVLKPQGKLLFIEHVAAVNNETRLRLQRFFEPIWKIIGRGCHLTRNTE